MSGDETDAGVELDKAGPGGGDEKVACRAYRAYFFDGKTLPAGLGVGFSGGTPNHELGYACVAYCSTPTAGKKKLLDMLASYRANGHMAYHNADEWKSGSHPTWYYSPVMVALGVALRRGDRDVVEACVDFLRRDQGSDLDSRVPYGSFGNPKQVIVEGARMWGGGEADQRKLRDLKTALLNGERIRNPEGMLDSLDLTWLRAWRTIQLEHPKEAADACAGIGRDERPTTRAVRHLVTWKDGHQSWVDGPLQQLKPCFGVKVTYGNKRVVYYGDENASKFSSPEYPPPGLIPPAPPGVPHDYEHARPQA